MRRYTWRQRAAFWWDENKDWLVPLALCAAALALVLLLPVGRSACGQ